MKLFGGTVPPNNSLFRGTVLVVLVKNTFLERVVPPNNELFGGTVLHTKKNGTSE